MMYQDRQVIDEIYKRIPLELVKKLKAFLPSLFIPLSGVLFIADINAFIANAPPNFNPFPSCFSNILSKGILLYISLITWLS